MWFDTNATPWLLADGGVAGWSAENRSTAAAQMLSMVSTLGVACVFVPMETTFMDSLLVCRGDELMAGDKKV